MKFNCNFIKIFVGILLFVSSNVNAQNSKTEEVCYNPNAKIDTSKRSIKSKAYALYKNDSIVINYHSPGVRNRVIWGGLVPMGEVWVTGAHDATNIEFPMDVVINGVSISKGKYAIFTIPNREEWIFIINKNFKQHLAWDYDVKDDAVRVKVKPTIVKTVTERLQYFINTNSKNKSGAIAMAWDKLKISIPFQIK